MNQFGYTVSNEVRKTKFGIECPNEYFSVFRVEAIYDKKYFGLIVYDTDEGRVFNSIVEKEVNILRDEGAKTHVIIPINDEDEDMKAMTIKVSIVFMEEEYMIYVEEI